MVALVAVVVVVVVVVVPTLKIYLSFCWDLFYCQTYVDCSKDGQFILTCSNGFNGKGCEATVSLTQLPFR